MELDLTPASVPTVGNSLRSDVDRHHSLYWVNAPSAGTEEQDAPYSSSYIGQGVPWPGICTERSETGTNQPEASVPPTSQESARGYLWTYLDGSEQFLDVGRHSPMVDQAPRDGGEANLASQPWKNGIQLQCDLLKSRLRVTNQRSRCQGLRHALQAALVDVSQTTVPRLQKAVIPGLSPPSTVRSWATPREKRKYKAAWREQIRQMSEELAAEEARLDEMERALDLEERHCTRVMQELLALKSDLGLQIAARDSAELGAIRFSYQEKLDRIAELTRKLDETDPAFNGLHPAVVMDEQNEMISHAFIGDPHDILLELEKVRSEAEHLRLLYPSLRKGLGPVSETTITTVSSMYYVPIEDIVLSDSADSGGIEEYQVDLSDESNNRRLRTSIWLFDVLRTSSVEKLQYDNILDSLEVTKPLRHDSKDWADYIYASWLMDPTVTGNTMHDANVSTNNRVRGSGGKVLERSLQISQGEEVSSK